MSASTPVLRVRETAHALGFRFRLHRRDLPAAPDLVFPRLRKAVLVNQCRAHHGTSCPLARVPSAGGGESLATVVGRDPQALAMLAALGWQPVVVWECETWDEAELRVRLVRFLGGT